MSGAVLFDARSAYRPGRRIGAVITGTKRPSANRKTGPMAQIWILSTSEATRRAVCGTCPRIEACYVERQKAPATVRRKWLAGGYPPADASIASGRTVRFGADGDPAALPPGTLEPLVAASDGWCSYTHAWRSRPDLRSWCMASVESEAEATEAQGLGWRTFRVRKPGERRMPGEAVCPYESSRGRVRCVDCRLCCGTASEAKSLVVTEH